jgi:hypothetical protein
MKRMKDPRPLSNEDPSPELTVTSASSPGEDPSPGPTLTFVGSPSSMTISHPVCLETSPEQLDESLKQRSLDSLFVNDLSPGTASLTQCWDESSRTSCDDSPDALGADEDSVARSGANESSDDSAGVGGDTMKNNPPAKRCANHGSFCQGRMLADERSTSCASSLSKSRGFD